MGSTVRGQIGVRLLDQPGATPTYQLPRNDGGFSGPKNLPASPKGAPCPHLFGQYNGGSLYKAQGRSQVPLQNGEKPPVMGTVQPVLTGGSSHAGQTEPWSGHAVLWQCVSRRMEDPPPNGSDDLGDLREGRGQPLCLRRQLSLPNIPLKGARRPGPRLAQRLPVRLPSDCSVPSGHHTS